MIKKGEVNLYNNTSKAILANRNLIKNFHKITGEQVIYLAVDYDTSETSDFIFGEDTFPSVVAVYKNIVIRTGDGKPLNLSRAVNPFGFQLANSKEVYLNMDHFFEETSKVNETIGSLKGSNWIPLNSDIVIDPVYNEVYKVNMVNENDAEQSFKDRNTFKITLVPHTAKNMDTSAIDFEEDSLPNSENIKKALDAVFGTQATNQETGVVEDIDKLDNKLDIKQDTYELNEDGEVIMTPSRKSILGEF